jgi:hypothetical protein
MFPEGLPEVPNRVFLSQKVKQLAGNCDPEFPEGLSEIPNRIFLSRKAKN